MRTLMRTSSALMLLCLAMATAWAPAGAAPIEHEHYVDEFDFVVDDFCGDMTVRIEGVFTGHFLVNERGRNKTPYVMESFHGFERQTNVATGKSITLVENGTVKDLKVTVNPDGTITALVMFNGVDRYYGPDGKFLFRGAGATWTELLFDDAGTPDDLSDDELIDAQVVRSAGPRPSAEESSCAAFRELTA